MQIFEDNNHASPEEFYTSLKEKLEATHEFPQDYLFKFIVENNPAKLTEIYRVFDGIKFTLSNKESKNGKYTSCNLYAFMMDANQVINTYKEVGKIEGVMML